MLKNAAPVNAAGLSTRRTVLRGLAAAPVALAIPAVILPSIVGETSPDVALIVQAAAVEKLTARAYAALVKACDLDGEVERLMPIRTRPKHIEAASQFDTVVTKEGDGTMVIRSTPMPIDPALAPVQGERATAIEAWNAEREAVARRVGHRAADRQWSRLYRRLKVETDKLTAMAPMTLAGALAKCRTAHTVFMETCPDASPNDWERDIMVSALRDLLAIGGGA